jgi:hypothetical protein
MKFSDSNNFGPTDDEVINTFVDLDFDFKKAAVDLKGLINSEKDTHNKREEQYSYINSNICIARLGRRQPEILH